MNSSNFWIRDLNLMKLRWKALEKERSTLLEFKNKDEIFTELKNIDKKCIEDFNRDASRMKSEIVKLKRIVQRLNKNTEQSTIPLEYKDKFERFTKDMQMKIDSLKSTINTNIEGLLLNEKQSSFELNFIESQIESWNRTEQNKIKISKKPAVIIDEVSKRPKEILNFEKFLLLNGGHTGGWEDQEHAIFLHFRRVYKGKSEFLDEVVRLLSTRTSDSILHHEQWYVKYLDLLEAKKEAIYKWRITKELEKGAKSSLVNSSICLKPGQINLASKDVVNLETHYKEELFASEITEELNTFFEDPHNFDEADEKFSDRFNRVAMETRQTLNEKIASENMQRPNSCVGRAILNEERDERVRLKLKIQEWKMEKEKLKIEMNAINIKKNNEEKSIELAKQAKQAEKRQNIFDLRQQKIKEAKEEERFSREQEMQLKMYKQHHATLLAAEITKRELERFKEKKYKERIEKEENEREKTERLNKLKSKVVVTTGRDLKRYMQPTIGWIEKGKPQLKSCPNSLPFNVDNLPHKSTPSWKHEFICEK